MAPPCFSPFFLWIFSNISPFRRKTRCCLRVVPAADAVREHDDVPRLLPAALRRRGGDRGGGRGAGRGQRLPALDLGALSTGGENGWDDGMMG